MAQKKPTQAQRATAEHTSGKRSAQKDAQKAVQQVQEDRAVIPGKWIAALVYLTLFLLFLFSALNQEGFVLAIIRNFAMGMFGEVAFYIALPALLFLTVIQFTCGCRSSLPRSLCVHGFIVLCGCISHLALSPVGLGSWLDLIANLYRGGSAGTTGGVICGLISELLLAAFGRMFCYVVMIIGALVCLLASFRITIPSIIRAIQNRPRFENEEEELQEAPEPAAVMVNHITNRRHAKKEQRRISAQERAALEAPAAEQALPAASEDNRSRDAEERMFRQIGTDAEPDGEGVVSDIPMTGEDPDLPETSVKPAAKPAPKAQTTVLPQAETKPEPVAEAPAETAPELKKVTAQEAATQAQKIAEEIEAVKTSEKPVYQYPPITLLEKPAKSSGNSNALELKVNARRLNEALTSFKIDAHITNVTCGPSVTRYEVELEPGVTMNKLKNRAQDIALIFGVANVLIAPVLGQSVIGIEIPNSTVEKVTLREVIDSQEFARARSQTSFAVGKDIGGTCIVGNIAKLPHLLIAGTTGSGKSVCMNSLILSLLYKSGPEDVKMIMVDPKMVELANYNDIPHLLIPVVTDPKKAAGALQWAVVEMLRRYSVMKDAGVRDLGSYNALVDEGQMEGEHLPKIVVIIDELADLMLVAAKEVDESICRIAQMGRAAGIHMIIATQRPSADVITGLMKANIPSRIAFAVSSAMESRIILDNAGAEKLVGMGDMLYAPIGCGKPVRVQGCYVDEKEVEAVTRYIKEHYVSDYDDHIIEEIDRKAEQTGNKAATATAADPEPNSAELDGDEMLPAAVDVILETNTASVSLLQRRLKLGYSRAARIVDEMEEKGIVGPFVGSKPRTILVTKEQWEQMKSGQTIINPPTDGDPFEVPADTED